MGSLRQMCCCRQPRMAARARLRPRLFVAGSLSALWRVELAACAGEGGESAATVGPPAGAESSAAGGTGCATLAGMQTSWGRSVSWGNTPSGRARAELANLQGRRTVELEWLQPGLTTASPLDVRLPAASAPCGAGGRLAPDALAAWVAQATAVHKTLTREAGGPKHAVVKKHHANCGLLNERLKAAGFGSYFEELTPGSGVWTPMTERGAHVKVPPVALAHILACMAASGRGVNDAGELVMIGAPLRCVEAALARAAARQGPS